MQEHQPPTPGVRNVTPDGRVVAVALQGARGRDREVILDADTWADVSARFGTSWVLDKVGGAPGPIRVLQGDGTGKARDDPIVLASYVSGASRESGRLCYHRDRDALNLRRCNLDAIDLGQWLRRGSPFPRVKRRPGVTS